MDDGREPTWNSWNNTLETLPGRIRVDGWSGFSRNMFCLVVALLIVYVCWSRAMLPEVSVVQHLLCFYPCNWQWKIASNFSYPIRANFLQNWSPILTPLCLAATRDFLKRFTKVRNKSLHSIKIDFASLMIHAMREGNLFFRRIWMIYRMT